MMLPPGKTEEEVLASIEKVIKLLAPGFVFGYHDKDDLLQQARMICWERLSKFDGVRPLENYLFVALRSRLLNWKRQFCRRADAPCKLCHNGTPCGAEGAKLCQPYLKWLTRNNTKANLMSPTHLGDAADEHEGTSPPPEQEIERGELWAKVDRELPVELRETYLKMRAGVKVAPSDEQAVVLALRAILGADEGD